MRTKFTPRRRTSPLPKFVPRGEIKTWPQNEQERMAYIFAMYVMIINFTFLKDTYITLGSVKTTVLHFKLGELSVWQFVSLTICQFDNLSVWQLVSLTICRLKICQFRKFSVPQIVSSTMYKLDNLTLRQLIISSIPSIVVFCNLKVLQSVSSARCCSTCSENF
jgi:hypothetical protein